MRHPLFVSVVICMLMLMTIGCTKRILSENAEWATLDGKPPIIIAHRGASGYLPEHTIEAYKLAIEQGADIIEPDLVITKDGVLIARHDRYLSTTTNVASKPEFADRKRVDNDPNGNGREDWWVEDFTLDEIKILRARQPREDRPQEFNDQYKIPTFDDVLTLAAQKADKHKRPVGVYPETKHPTFFESIDLDFEAPLLAALDGFDAGPIFIQSFEPEILKRLKGKTDAKLVQLVYEETPGAGPNIPLAEIAEYADGIGPEKSLLFSARNQLTGFVIEAHAYELTVHPWTFRDDVAPTLPEEFVDNYFLPEHSLFDDKPINQQEYIAFLLIGVDGVFTDFPDTAVKMRDAMQASAK